MPAPTDLARLETPCLVLDHTRLERNIARMREHLRPFQVHLRPHVKTCKSIDVFMFFDLVMAGIGVCSVDDIAVSVLTSVIGHRPEKGWTIVDAGWMALSRDRGTSQQDIDQGYGTVCDIDGRPLEDLIVFDANQEHGIVARRPGSTAPLPALPVGTPLRVLPSHACATSAQHDRYHVVESGSRIVSNVWPRIGGW